MTGKWRDRRGPSPWQFLGSNPSVDYVCKTKGRPKTSGTEGNFITRKGISSWWLPEMSSFTGSLVIQMRVVVGTPRRRTRVGQIKLARVDQDGHLDVHSFPYESGRLGVLGRGRGCLEGGVRQDPFFHGWALSFNGQLYSRWPAPPQYIHWWFSHLLWRAVWESFVQLSCMGSGARASGGWGLAGEQWRETSKTDADSQIPRVTRLSARRASIWRARLIRQSKEVGSLCVLSSSKMRSDKPW